MRIFEHIKKVEFSDVDMGGVLYHPNYIVYLDQARSACLDEIGFPFQKLFAINQVPMVVSIKSTYLKPAFLGQTIYIYSHISKSGNTSFCFTQTLFNKKQSLYSPEETLQQSKEKLPEDLIHLAEVSLVWVDMLSKKPTAPNEELRLAFANTNAKRNMTQD